MRFGEELERLYERAPGKWWGLLLVGLVLRDSLRDLTIELRRCADALQQEDENGIGEGRAA